MPAFDDKGVFDGYIVAVESTSKDLIGDDIYSAMVLVKIDLKGNVLWQHIYYQAEDFGFSFFADSFGNVYKENNDTGEKIWSRHFANLTRRIVSYYDEKGNDNGIIAIGSNYHDSHDFITIFDLDGNEIFTNFGDTGESLKYYDFINTKNEKGLYDGYLTIGAYTDTDYGFIIKYSREGKVVWKKDDSEKKYFSIFESYNSDGNFNGYVVLAQDNDDLVISRYTYPSYKIDMKEDNEGTITVNKNGFPGEIVKVSVTPKEGYTLKRIVVMDENGKEIEASKDGTFVMPEGNVTVTAIYNRITNPKTVSACYVVLGIILLISIGTLIVNKKKEA